MENLFKGFYEFNHCLCVSNILHSMFIVVDFVWAFESMLHIVTFINTNFQLVVFVLLLVFYYDSYILLQ